MLAQRSSNGSPVPGSHWNPKTANDEMMIPYSVPQGNRMTALTMNLLKDTGYYAEVNTELVDDTLFGKNEGCGFAFGTSTSNKP